MGSSVESQAYVFLATLYGGILIGFIYDIYRIFRYFFRPKKVATFIEDLIFWIIVSITALLILIFSNWGEVRGYVFLGFISGALLYHKLLSKPVIMILVYISRFLLSVFKKVLGLILYPFRLLGKIIYSPYSKAKSKVGRGYRKAKKVGLLPKKFLKDIKKHVNIIKKKK